MNKMHTTHPPRPHLRLGRGAGFALGLLALCLGLLLLPRPVAAQAPITPDNPCLASQELTSLTVASPGGQSLRGIANQPVVNRDGANVAFWSTNDLISGQNRDGNIEIFFRSLAGQQPNQLTDSVGSILGGFNLNPAINAAGDRVAFFSDRPLTTRNLGRRNTDGNFEIFLAVRTGNSWAIDQITDTQLGANLFPSISGDGTRIAFVSDEADLHNIDGSRSNPNRTFQIFLATIGGNGAVTFRQITQTGPGVINDAPVISADGRRIAFTQSVGDTSHIYLWDAANPNTTVRLTEANSNDQPAINADGSRIAYVSTTPAGRSRIVLYIAGSAQQGDRSEVIVPQSGTRQFRSPSISDNGLRVAYVAETATSAGPQVDVYLFDTTIHSQGGVPITTGATEQPTISGNGAHVVYVRLATEVTGTDDVGSQIRSTDCPLADLALTPVNAVPATVLAGIDLVYTFRLTNHGPSMAGNARVEVEDIARPSQVTLSAELSDDRCTLTTGGMTCALGDLASGASTEFRVGWSVPENAALDDIRSRLRAFANAIDPDPARADSGVLVTRVTEVANLVLTKTGAPQSGADNRIQAGGTTNYIYELRLQNTGPSRARESVLIDNLPNNIVIAPGAQPASFLVQGHDPNASCALVQNNRVVRCELGNVPAGTVTIVRIPVRATAAAVGQVINQARVESETEDLTPATRQTSLTTTVFAPADMEITKTVDTGAQGQVVIAGNTITYTVTVRNLGTANAGNVMVDGLLPANVTFVTGTTGCAGTGANQGISCALGTMNTGTQRVLTIVGRVAPAAPAGTINNSFRVQSNREDTDLSNNESTPVDITVIRRADVELVSKTVPVNTLPPGGANTVRAGETLRYNIVMRNNGPSTAANARMVDTLPPGVEFVGASAGCTHPGGVGAIGGVVTCQAGTLNPNATASFFIDVRRTVAGNILNTAAAHSDTQDDVPGNNSRNLSVTVHPAPTTQLVYTQFPQTSVPYINSGATLADTVVAGEISSNIQLVRRDQFGNINNWEPALNVTLTDIPPGNARSAFLNTSGNVISSISIPQAGTVTYRYRDERAGTVALRAAAGGGITAAQRDLTVLAAPATKLAIISNPHTAVTAGVISPIITVQRQDQFNNPNWYEPAVTVGLEVVAGPLGLRNQAFYHATNDTLVTQVTIAPTATNLPAGSRASFRYYDERAGSKTINVQAQSEPALASDSQQIAIVPDVATQLRFTEFPTQIVASLQPSVTQQFRVERLDTYENPNSDDILMTIELSGDPPTGSFFTSGGTPLPDPPRRTIEPGSSFALFTYADRFAGNKTIRAEWVSGGPVTVLPDSVDILVVAGPAVTLELQFEPAEQTIQAGELSDLITVTRYDELENPADQDPALDVLLHSSSAGDFRFFDSNVVELLPPPTITIADMTASATFYYSDTLAARHHITGTGGGLQAATGTITVTAAPAYQLAFITAERTITAGQTSQVITIQQQDRFANPADQEEFDLEIQLEESSGSLSVQFLDEVENPLDLPIVLHAGDPDPPGETDASFRYYNELAGTHHITATAPLTIPIETQTITVLPDVPSQLTLDAPPHNLQTAGEPLTSTTGGPIILALRDQYDNLMTTDSTSTVTATVESGPGNFSSDSTTWVTLENGFATFGNLKLLTAGQYTLRFNTSVGEHITTVTALFTVQPGEPAGLEIRRSDGAQNFEVPAGIATSLVITAYDIHDNPTHNYNTSRPLRFFGSVPSPNHTSPTVTNASGTAINFGLDTSLNFSQGVITGVPGGQGQMVLTNVGPSQVITAELRLPNGTRVHTRPGGHLMVDVVHGELYEFDLSLTDPQTNTLPFTGDNTVTALDGYGNPVENFNPSLNALTFTVDQGVVGFNTGNNVIADDVMGEVLDLMAYGMVYTGTAASEVVFTVTSTGPVAQGQAIIEVLGGPPRYFEMTPTLEPWVAGERTVSLSARDISGNIAVSYEDERPLIFSGANGIGSNLPYVIDKHGAVLAFGNETRLDFIAGVVDSTVISMGLVLVESPTVVVSEMGASPALTGSFTVEVVHGPATQLTITTQPVGGMSGGELTVQPIVEIRDEFGNLADTANNNVSVAIESGVGGTLGGTMTVAAVNGVATFTDLTLAGTVGENYVLRFSSGSLTHVDSIPVTVTPGAPDQLAITVQPEGGASGEELETQPVVEIRDAQGNLAITASNNVTVEIQSGVGGTLGGPMSVAAVNGVAEFEDLTLAGTVGENYVLRFGSVGLTAVDSDIVTVTAGLPITFTVLGPSSVVSGTVSDDITIQIEDGYGNPSPVSVDTDFQIAITTTETISTAGVVDGIGNPISPVITVSSNQNLATFNITATLSDTVESGIVGITVTKQAGQASIPDASTYQINVGVLPEEEDP